MAASQQKRLWQQVPTCDEVKEEIEDTPKCKVSKVKQSNEVKDEFAEEDEDEEFEEPHQDDDEFEEEFELVLGPDESELPAKLLEELPRYHEFHGRLTPARIAWSLRHHIGLELNGFELRKGLGHFFGRYLKSDVIDFFFEHEWWGQHCRAVLRTPSLGRSGRSFEGKWVEWNRGIWEGTQKEAEISAIEMFQRDSEVLEIARNLPPSSAKINIKVNSLFCGLPQKFVDKTSDAGVSIWTVRRELVDTVYLLFRNMGCRTALWDGVA